MLKKVFNSWSDTNKKTNGQIELGFCIIGLALSACSIFSIPLLCEPEAPYWTVLASSGCIILGMASAGFANSLKKDRLKELSTDESK